LLLGGSQVAQGILPVGEQGEGLDLAADYLNSLGNAEQLRVAVQDEANLMFKSNFVGQVFPFNSPDPDYVMFATHVNQRGGVWNDHWSGCQQEDSSWSVSFDGVPYVWVCPTYPRDPASIDIDQRLDYQLGDLVGLVGFDLSSDSLSAGETISTTLYWQARKQIPGDFHVFLHLIDAQGRLVTQDDGVPVQGEQPTWKWLDGEIIEDGHSLVIPDDLETGNYILSVGLYDFATLERLPVFSQDGQHIPENKIILREFQVDSP